MTDKSGIHKNASWLSLLGLIFCSASLASAHVFARLSCAYGVNVLTAAAARLTCASVLVFIYLCGLGINGVFMLLPGPGATQTAVALNLEPVMVASSLSSWSGNCSAYRRSSAR